MSYSSISKCVEGIKSTELKKLLCVSNEHEFNREMLKIGTILGQFGLELRYFASNDEWFLMCPSENPPEDLSKTVLTTLAIIYDYNIKKSPINVEILKNKRNLTIETIRKQIQELEKKNYIIIKEHLLEITSKTKLLIKLKEE